jgi:hypothetical protein
MGEVDNNKLQMLGYGNMDWVGMAQDLVQKWLLF